MTAKEKAMSLYLKFYKGCDIDGEYVADENACKQLALILAQEVLNNLFQHHKIDYWKEVKKEIELL